MNEVRQIELVKKSYEELQDMVIQLTTDKFILQSKIDKAIEILENIPINANGSDILETERKVYHILKEDKE